jgi:hypothetical protein
MLNEETQVTKPLNGTSYKVLMALCASIGRDGKKPHHIEARYAKQSGADQNVTNQILSQIWR